MNSIFDQEQGLLRSPLLMGGARAMDPVQYEPTERAPSYIPPSSALDLVYGMPKATTTKRKPTKLEALQKLSMASPPSLSQRTPGGIQRVARKPLMLYQNAFLLAGALILIDPLDRTEGLY